MDVEKKVAKLGRQDLLDKYEAASQALFAAIRKHEFVNGRSNRDIASEQRRAVVTEIEQVVGRRLTDGLVVIKGGR